MKIAIVGATGIIGQAVYRLLSQQHQVLQLSRTQGDYLLDITSKSSIEDTFKSIGALDAVICTAGSVAFQPFQSLTEEDWQLGLNSKLLGQLHLSQVASQYLTTGGSITLTSGIIADHPITAGLSAATINGALHHFVKAASVELPDQQRINIVSPTMVTESKKQYQAFFPGFMSVDADKLAMFYMRSVMGVETGEIFRAYG
ncbi:MAG: short chain dehydrogenase [Parashewanella sp.]